jgi:hypothetical protein
VTVDVVLRCRLRHSSYCAPFLSSLLLLRPRSNILLGTPLQHPQSYSPHTKQTTRYTLLMYYLSKPCAAYHFSVLCSYGFCPLQNHFIHFCINQANSIRIQPRRDCYYYFQRYLIKVQNHFLLLLTFSDVILFLWLVTSIYGLLHFN